ncbi:fluoride efflux transporter CrcB [Sciscionella marina]|uniref:fluoride efflux transporter CrcB n=1 Tax=Sciscionella marina TaxID=508770 RepID=UPI00036F9FF2|nr:fluoride efflux transporter CrcB [Sciscionella marina]
MTVLVWIAVALIGGAGSVLRFLVDGAVSARFGGRFPLGTFVVNCTGAVLLGLVGGLAFNGDAALLAGTAAVGSYTTFSTWMLETHRVGEERRVAAAVSNVLLSLVFGVGAAALGQWIGVRL